VRRIGELLGVRDGRLWRSLRALVETTYAEADMSQVTAVGIDEKHIGRGRVVTVVHESRPAHAGGPRVLHISEGAKADNVGQFVAELSTHGGDPLIVQHCTLDMARSYIAGVAKHLPNAQACFDPFHLVKLA